MQTYKRFRNILISLLSLLVLFSCAYHETNTIELIAGTGSPGFQDGNPGELHKPIRLAPYGEKSILFADINNHAIRMVDLEGNVKSIAGGPDKKGFKDGPAEEAMFNSPHGIAYDSEKDHIYVVEAGNHTLRLISRDDPGNYQVSTLAGSPGSVGFADGSGDSAKFISPHAVILDGRGGAYVADIGNARVRMHKDGVVSSVAGSGTSGNEDGSPESASFTYVMDIVFQNEDILLADAGSHLIRRISLGEKVSTITLKDSLDTPHGIAADGSGNIYIADMGSHRILQIKEDGTVLTLAGTGQAGEELNALNKPAAVLVHAGYLWIADLENHQIKAIKLRY